MIFTFFDRQEKLNPLNGTKMADPEKFAQLLESLRHRKPFFCELIGDNGYTLLLGVGEEYGCSQYTRSDGNPPYLMALGNKENHSDQYLEFLTADTPTPIARRYWLSFETLKRIARHFLATGQNFAQVDWEEI